MLPEEFKQFLHIATAICAIMAIISLVRIKKLGNSAIMQAGAFVSLGILTQLLRFREDQVPMWAIVINGVVVVIFLGADMAIRADKRAQAEADKMRQKTKKAEVKRGKLEL